MEIDLKVVWRHHLGLQGKNARIQRGNYVNSLEAGILMNYYILVHTTPKSIPTPRNAHISGDSPTQGIPNVTDLFLFFFQRLDFNL